MILLTPHDAAQQGEYTDYPDSYVQHTGCRFLLEVLSEAVPHPDGTLVGRIEVFVESHGTAVALLEFLIGDFVCQPLRSECQVVYTVALAVYKLKCREGNKCRGRETVLVGVDAYYLIGHSLYIDILSYRLGTWKQHLDSLFVQYDHLPAFLHVAVVDETSLFQFYSFQFRIVGKDALQRNGNVFLAEVRMASLLLMLAPVVMTLSGKASAVS